MLLTKTYRLIPEEGTNRQRRVRWTPNMLFAVCWANTGVCSFKRCIHEVRSLSRLPETCRSYVTFAKCALSTRHRLYCGSVL